MTILLRQILNPYNTPSHKIKTEDSQFGDNLDFQPSTEHK